MDEPDMHSRDRYCAKPAPHREQRPSTTCWKKVWAEIAASAKEQKIAARRMRLPRGTQHPAARRQSWSIRPALPARLPNPPRMLPHLTSIHVPNCLRWLPRRLRRVALPAHSRPASAHPATAPEFPAASSSPAQLLPELPVLCLTSLCPQWNRSQATFIGGESAGAASVSTTEYFSASEYGVSLR
jgi:hypothetical protein